MHINITKLGLITFFILMIGCQNPDGSLTYTYSSCHIEKSFVVPDTSKTDKDVNQCFDFDREGYQTIDLAKKSCEPKIKSYLINKYGNSSTYTFEYIDNYNKDIIAGNIDEDEYDIVYKFKTTYCP